MDQVFLPGQLTLNHHLNVRILKCSSLFLWLSCHFKFSLRKIFTISFTRGHDLHHLYSFCIYFYFFLDCFFLLFIFSCLFFTFMSLLFDYEKSDYEEPDYEKSDYELDCKISQLHWFVLCLGTPHCVLALPGRFLFSLVRLG